MKKVTGLILGGLLLIPGSAFAQEPGEIEINSRDVKISSGGKAYASLGRW
jgi:hypothetical protein